MICMDAAANRKNPKGQFIMCFFRFAQCFAMRKYSILWWAGLPVLVLYRVLTDYIMGIELKPNTVIGAGLRIEHGFALVVNKNTVIGENVLLRHSTTIGCQRRDDGSEGPSPVIGDNVDIGAHVVILGGITIGDNVKIGAGTVVTKDIPPGATVIGNPARIIG